MNRICKRLRDRPVGLDRPHDAGALDAQNQILEPPLLKQPHISPHLLDHQRHPPLGRNIPGLQVPDAGLVDANANGDPVFTGAVNHPLDLPRILDVAGVEPDLGRPRLDRLHRAIGRKMDVRDQRHIDLLHDPPEGLRIRFRRHRQPHQIAPGRRQLADLPHARRYIRRIDLRHRLYGHGALPPIRTCPMNTSLLVRLCMIVPAGNLVFPSYASKIRGYCRFNYPRQAMEFHHLRSVSWIGVSGIWLHLRHFLEQ